MGSSFRRPLRRRLKYREGDYPKITVPRDLNRPAVRAPPATWRQLVRNTPLPEATWCVAGRLSALSHQGRPNRSDHGCTLKATGIKPIVESANAAACANLTAAKALKRACAGSPTAANGSPGRRQSAEQGPKLPVRNSHFRRPEKQTPGSFPPRAILDQRTALRSCAGRGAAC